MSEKKNEVKITLVLKKGKSKNKRLNTWASAAGGRGRAPLLPRIFKHGTNIVDRGSKVLFFGLFLLFFSFVLV